MNIGGIHHVAFAHGDETIVTALTALLGLGIEHVEDGEGFTERMFPAGECYLQTLQATGPGVVKRFVEGRGPALHHVAFTVDDIDEALAGLAGKGVELVDEAPRAGGMGTRIAFIHPRSFGGLLVELVEVAGVTEGQSNDGNPQPAG